MRAEDDRKALEKEVKRWEASTLRNALESLPERRKEFVTTSSRPVRRLYTPLDLDGEADETRVGKPGEFPFTRGIHPTMYRGRLWTMRMFAGYGSAEDTNRRFKYLIAHGETGLSVAFDMPTLYGYDTDQPEAKGEFGTCGVAVSSPEDMRLLFHGIDVGQVSTSMTINSPAAVIWAMYLAAAEERKLPRLRTRNCWRPCRTAPPPALELARESAPKSCASVTLKSRIFARSGLTSYCLIEPPIVTTSATPGARRSCFSTTQSSSVRSSCGDRWSPRSR